MDKGLTLDNLVNIIGTEIPTNEISGLLRRLPHRFYDSKRQLYRPVAAAVLIGLSLVTDLDDDDGLDQTVADLIEVSSLDPDPELESWTRLPCGKVLRVSHLLTGVADRIASLYAESPRKRIDRPRSRASV